MNLDLWIGVIVFASGGACGCLVIAMCMLAKKEPPSRNIPCDPSPGRPVADELFDVRKFTKPETEIVP